jgi:Trk K+ transport system NAD-binding subunit
VGDDRLGARVLEELRALGIDVIAVCEHAGASLAQAARAAGVRLVIGVPHDQATLHRAFIGGAHACGLPGSTDLDNLSVALGLQELPTRARVVMRLHHASLGDSVRELVGDVSVLSPIELAAPAFVQAALRDSADFVLRLGERRLAVQEIDRADPALRLAIAAAGDDRDGVEIFPVGPTRVIGIVDQGRVEERATSASSDALDLRIAARQTTLIEAARQTRQAWQMAARFLTGVFDRRLALVGAVLGAAIVVFSIAFVHFMPIGLRLSRLSWNLRRRSPA